MSVKIEIMTNGGADIALTKVLGGALEKTYKVLPEGESARLAAALDKFEKQQQQVETPAPELHPAKAAALAIGDAMKALVQASDHAAPSRVAHVAEISVAQEAKGRA